MVNPNEGFRTTRSGDFETAGTEFKMTMDPQSKEIYIEGKSIGFLMWHNGAFVVKTAQSSILPIGLLADIQRERNRILESSEEKQSQEARTEPK